MGCDAELQFGGCGPFATLWYGKRAPRPTRAFGRSGRASANLRVGFWLVRIDEMLGIFTDFECCAVDSTNSKTSVDPSRRPACTQPFTGLLGSKAPLAGSSALTLHGFHDDDGNLFHAKQTALAGQRHLALLERLASHFEPLGHISN